MRPWCSVSTLSISNCEYLTFLEAESLVDLETLETLLINNNPNLVYIHPQAILRAPSLTNLELMNNNLTILEDIRWVIQTVKLIFYKTKFSTVINPYYVNFQLKLVSK